MHRYRVKDIEEVVKMLERGVKMPSGNIDFFRDFAIIQSVEHPDFDRGYAIGSLATRIE